MRQNLKNKKAKVVAEGKRLTNEGLISEALAYYETELTNEELITDDKTYKARLQVELARRLIDLELFSRAETLLAQAESELGDDKGDEAQSVAFWKIRFALGKLQFRSMNLQ